MTAVAGVVLTEVTVGGHTGFVRMPSGSPYPGPRPWVWYAPTFTGIYPDADQVWLFSHLAQRGFAVAGVDVGESWGAPPGRQVFSQFHEHMVTTFDLDPQVTLLAQSRGALMLYNWAAENVALVQRIGAIFPVCDLRSYPGLAAAAGAYGVRAEELEQSLHLHNPTGRLAPLAKADIPFFHVHGDSDDIVPLDDNSAVLRDHYREVGGRMELLVVPGKGHEVVAEFFECAELLEFLTGDRQV